MQRNQINELYSTSDYIQFKKGVFSLLKVMEVPQDSLINEENETEVNNFIEERHEGEHSNIFMINHIVNHYILIPTKTKIAK